MTWLFFIDESGHDHKAMPYEVRGGIALHVKHLWPFVQDVRRLELDCFGCRLSDFGKEIKGSTLIDRKRYKFAGQKENFQDGDRRKLCRSFLEKGRRHDRPNRDEFTAYGQACIRMAQKISAYTASIGDFDFPREGWMLNVATRSRACSEVRLPHFNSVGRDIGTVAYSTPMASSTSPIPTRQGQDHKKRSQRPVCRIRI